MNTALHENFAANINTDGACFHHGISKCKGLALRLNQPAIKYTCIVNDRRFNFQSSNFMIVDKGRRRFGEEPGLDLQWKTWIWVVKATNGWAIRNK
jgi:hypothetical protein